MTEAPSKSEREGSHSGKPGAQAQRIEEADDASFDVKNLSAKHATPLQASVVPTQPAKVEEDISVSGPGRRVHFPLEVPSAPSPRAEKPQSPVRHTRIPSTGNRATVMDVAQALQAHEEHSKKTPEEEVSMQPEATVPSSAVGSDVGAVRPAVKAMIANWGPQANEEVSSPPMEKRKSSYEKYSAFTMPPLFEEKTPVQSPAGTLSRDVGRSVAGANGTASDVKQDSRGCVAMVEEMEPKIQEAIPRQTASSSIPAPAAVEDKFVHFRESS